MNMNKTKVIVIGAGASGLFAALCAAKNGADVLILEREQKPGRKLLATGNGKCNLTNTGDPSFAYRGADPAFALSVLDGFSVQDTISAFLSFGMYTTNHNGWVYPYAETSTGVLSLLLSEAKENRVRIKMNEDVISVAKEDDIFRVRTDGWEYTCDRLILACGSNASFEQKKKKLKKSDMLSLAEAFGHTIVPPLPALCPLFIKEAEEYRFSNVRLNAAVTLYVGNEAIEKESGQIQFADYGISGIPVFDISHAAGRALNDGKNVTVTLDLFPEMDENYLSAFLTSLIEKHPDRPMDVILSGIFPERIIPAILAAADLKDPALIAKRIKTLPLTVTGTAGFEKAQVTSGGISTAEVDPDTMESLLVPGLFLTGEILDIDGRCGGWNLQFAWSTGALAGRAASGGRS